MQKIAGPCDDCIQIFIYSYYLFPSVLLQNRDADSYDCSADGVGLYAAQESLKWRGKFYLSTPFCSESTPPEVCCKKNYKFAVISYDHVIFPFRD